jgi:hypothetical protein
MKYIKKSGARHQASGKDDLNQAKGGIVKDM